METKHRLQQKKAVEAKIFGTTLNRLKRKLSDKKLEAKKLEPTNINCYGADWFPTLQSNMVTQIF